MLRLKSDKRHSFGRMLEKLKYSVQKQYRDLKEFIRTVFNDVFENYMRPNTETATSAIVLGIQIQYRLCTVALQ
jgi:hypothetical protein